MKKRIIFLASIFCFFLGGEVSAYVEHVFVSSSISREETREIKQVVSNLDGEVVKLVAGRYGTTVVVKLPNKGGRFWEVEHNYFYLVIQFDGEVELSPDHGGCVCGHKEVLESIQKEIKKIIK